MSIKKGDLVMVVKPMPCCGNSKTVGYVETVLGVESGFGICWCGAQYAATVVVTNGDRSGFVISTVKKIDPPSTGELDGVPLRLKEPA